MQMGNKGNVVLYLDKELVEKSKELGFNLSKTFEAVAKTKNKKGKIVSPKSELYIRLGRYLFAENILCRDS